MTRQSKRLVVFPSLGAILLFLWWLWVPWYYHTSATVRGQEDGMSMLVFFAALFLVVSTIALIICIIGYLLAWMDA
jgi:hypothetical protein